MTSFNDHFNAMFVDRERWHVLSFVLLAVSVVGTSYAFGVFSEVFKNELNYSQSDLSVVSSCGSTGLYTGVLVGLLMEWQGPRFILLLGAFLIFSGNFYTWLAVQKLVNHSVGALSVVWFFAQVGTACSSATGLVVGIRIFPSSVRGRIAGIAKGYFGIASAVLSSISTGFFGEGSVDFILFVAIALPVIQIFCVPHVHFISEEKIPFTNETTKNLPISLFPFFTHLGILFLTILFVGGVEYSVSLSKSVKMVLGSIVALIVFFVVLLENYYKPDSRFFNFFHSKNSSITNKENDKNTQESTVNPVNAIKQTENPLNQDITSTSSHDEESMNEHKEESKERSLFQSVELEVEEDILSKQREESKERSSFRSIELEVEVEQKEELNERISFFDRHVHLQEIVFTWRAYALMMVFTVLAGSGLLVINNIQAIAQALDQSPSNFFVTLVSLANSAGRVLIGIVADFSLSRDILTRLRLLAVISGVMAFAQMLLCLGIPELLYFCLLLVGCMFGAGFSCVSAIVADMWGAKYIGSNYGFIDISPIIGSYVFSTGLITTFYPEGSTENDEDDDGSSCVGAHCFRYPFIITTCSCVFGAFLCLFIDFYTPMNFRKRKINTVSNNFRKDPLINS